MGYFNFDFEKYRPSSSQGKPLQPKGLQPTLQLQTKTLQPTLQPQITAQPTPMPDEDKSIMQKVFDAFLIPSTAVGGFLQGTRRESERRAGELKAQGKKASIIDYFNSFKEGVKNIPSGIQNKVTPSKYLSEINPTDPISQAAKDFGTSGAGGLATDIIADPLNVVNPFAIAGKIPGITKTVSKAKEIVSKIPLPKVGVENRIVKPGLTTVGEVGENLKQKFVRGYGLPEEYNLAKSNIVTRVGSGAREIIDRTKQQFVGLKKNIVEAIPKFLEPKGAGSGFDLGALRKELGEETFQKVRPVLREVKEQFNADIIDLVKRGRMTGETAKRLLNQGGYYPHTDFAPQRIKEYFVRPKLGEKRTYLKRRKGLEGFTFNAPKAIARRELNQFQDNVIQDFFREVKTKFGVKIGTGKPMPEGYVQFLSDSPRVAELRGYALPAKIAQDINASISTGGDIGKAIDTFNALWKPTATSWNPAFHIMNVMGNLYNSWLGGMKDPRRFLQAVRGGVSGDEATILKRAGILDRGQFIADNVARTFDNPLGLDLIKVNDRFTRMGNFFENNARSAFFLDQYNKFLRTGLSTTEASRKAVQKVNEYLFDYLTGLTPFETNVMRRTFPFYTWARFNIPLQFKTLITQPEKVAVVSKINRTLNQGGNPEGDYEGITIPTPFTDSKGDQIRYRPNLPIQDIFGLDLKRIGGYVNPLFKEAANLGLYAFGGEPSLTDPFSGKEITNKNLPVGTQVKDIAGSRAKGLLRPYRTVTKVADEDFSPSGIMRQLIGGTYTLPKESVELRKVGKKNAVNAAINKRIQDIYRDQSMTREEKLREINTLRQSLQ